MPSPTLPPDAFWLPTYGKTNGIYQTMLMSDAGIRADRPHGCVWLTDANGKHAALWPPGYYARWNPLRIYDEKGHLVWNATQRYDIGSGFSSVHVDQIKPACRTPGDEKYAWWVSPAPSWDPPCTDEPHECSGSPSTTPTASSSPSPSPTLTLPTAGPATAVG